jgi:hypothetical protein
MPDRSGIKDRRLRLLLEALDAAGWDLRPGRFPGQFGADHPCMFTEVPTPEWVGRGWPFPTYKPLRQLWVSVNQAGRVYFILSRTGVPWVNVAERTLSHPKALAFIAQPVDSAGRPVEVGEVSDGGAHNAAAGGQRS